MPTNRWCRLAFFSETDVKEALFTTGYVASGAVELRHIASRCLSAHEVRIAPAPSGFDDDEAALASYALGATPRSRGILCRFH